MTIDVDSVMKFTLLLPDTMWFRDPGIETVAERMA